MEKFSGLPKSKEGYRVELEEFSGPMELLLHLIRTQEIDIYNIPIARITAQYLEYLKLMEKLDLDVAGEFLVMAATLIYIKSKTLLPEEPSGGEEAEEEAPRTELIEVLLEYKRYQGAAGELGELASQRREIFDRGVDIAECIQDDFIEADVFSLISAFRSLLGNIEKESVREITRSSVTVKEKIEELLNIIKEKDRFAFSEFFNNVSSKLEAVVSFLAILELIKQKKIFARQSKIFGEINILRREK